MANRTGDLAAETQESYETATPVRPESQSPLATAARRPERFIKTIVRDVAEGFRMQEDKGSGVILFKFDQAPHPEIQQVLADKEFKWSETKGAWARPTSYEGRVAAEQVIEAIRAAVPKKVPGR